jgi:hypothetical protein
MSRDVSGMHRAAPIAIFTYRRAEHLRRTLEALSHCDLFKESPLLVFADGARGASDASDVTAARRVAVDMLAGQAEFHFADANRGLARSVIAGVSEATRQYGRVIVVEDDLEVSPNFLRYMNEALDRYADCTSVYQVSGHMFDVPELRGRGSAMFLPLTTSWGWATWRRAWDQFDPVAQGWERLASDRALRRRFNLGGVYDYAGMLERQMNGIGDSWAVRWNWTVFSHDGLTLFPSETLVRNSGLDGSGTHGRGWLRRFGGGHTRLWPHPVALPEEVAEDAGAFAGVRKAIWLQNGGALGSLADVAKLVLGRLRLR